MKYTKSIFGAVILTLVLGALPAAAQAPSSSYVASTSAASPSPNLGDDPTDSVLTIRKRVDEVNVLFIATDKHGKFVRNLTQNDFSFLDDHKPVQSIVSFRRETDLPLKMGLLIDVSGSVHTRFDFEQVIVAVAILVDPSSDRIAHIARLDLIGPVAAIRCDEPVCRSIYRWCPA